MTNRIVRRSYTSTLPLMMGVLALNTPSFMSSESTDSIIESLFDQSSMNYRRILNDEPIFSRINDYVKDNYDVKVYENRQMNLTSDLFYFNFVHNFIDEQVNLDADFLEALNTVTMKVGKAEPTKSRF